MIAREQRGARPRQASKRHGLAPLVALSPLAEIAASSRDGRRVVSIVRETRPGEQRVILLPPAGAALAAAGFRVLVERRAGAGVGAHDEADAEAGAHTVDTDTAWQASPYVLKYEEPTPEEYERLRPGLHLGAFFHAEGNPPLVHALRERGVTAYSDEFFQTADGEFPLAAPGAEISGKVTALSGAYHLRVARGEAAVRCSATSSGPSGWS